jgi:acetyl esterase
VSRPPLDPQLVAWLDTLRGEGRIPAREIGHEALRQGSRRRAESRPGGPRLPSVEGRLIPGEPPLPARLYRPALEARPLVVYLHGGMWLLGDLETHDRTCRQLAVAADAAVLAVDYRRAPEDPWPAAVEDAIRAVRWATGEAHDLGGRAGGVAVAGDSAGAHLATLVCLRLREAGGPLTTAQALAYPNTDLTLSQPSIRESGTGWGLDADDLAWAVEQWVPDEARRGDPNVSPLHAPDLSGLPPALIVTAEHDPLRDEGDAYAARLEAAGTPVRHGCEPGLVHGFLQGLDLVSPVAAAATDRFFEDVRELVRRPT